MNLNISYSANAQATAPVGFFNAVNYVSSVFDSTFTNNVTVSIEVGYGDFPEDNSTVAPLGESDQASVAPTSYTQVRSALLGQGAPGSGTLPSSSTITGTLMLPTAQEKALGIIPNNNSLDGWIGIASDATLQTIGSTWSFDPTAPLSSTQFYIVGTIEHEISEVMGRTSYLDQFREYGIVDLYRYQSANTRQLTASGNPSYFSTDNGVTAADYWNNASLKPQEDFADWAPNGPNGVHPTGADAFLSESPPGQINALTPTDLTLMAALGWTIAVPRPAVVSVMTSGPGITNGTGDLDAGKTAILTVNMNQVVTVTGGIPSLMLNDGGSATYTGGSGSSALTFSYTVATGQNTTELAVTAVNLNGATIANGSGNTADLSGAVTNLGGILQIDTSAPGIMQVSTSPGSGTVGVGQQITLTLRMSEMVTIAGGTPSLTLNDGGSASFVSGSGSSALMFSYTVAAGQSTSNLMVTAVNPNGATIADAAGNTASLSLTGLAQSGPSVTTSSSNTSTITLSPNASFTASNPNTTVQGGGGTTNVTLQGAGSVFLGDAGNDMVTITGSNTTVVGASGNTTVNAGTGSVQVFTGTGPTLINAGNSAITVYGGTAALTVNATASGGSLMVFANTGPLFFSGGGSASTVVGGMGSGAGTDTVFANGGGLYFGGSGSLLFIGGAGVSTVVGGSGDNTLFGGSSGRDVIVAGYGPSTLVGADGNSLVGLGANQDVLVAGSGNESLVGSGGGGGDIMFANRGDIAMFAGTGNDTFVASSGTAQMVGGPGNDLFAFVSGATGGSDTIWNFTHGQDQVALFGYGTGTVSTLLASAVVSGGGTTITLPDNTRITFGNLTHLTASDLFAA